MTDLYKIDDEKNRWKGDSIMKASFTCGYCGMHVTSDEGMALIRLDEFYGKFNDAAQGVYVCTNCHMPTFIYKDIQVPGDNFGSKVQNVPSEVNDVYEEARKAYSVGSYTGTILLCRKLLMHVGVDFGAEENKNFVYYVDYLKDQHYVSANSDKWIDSIRKFGNTATHEIIVNTKEDAQKMIKFSEMLLKMNYEYPADMEE